MSPAPKPFGDRIREKRLAKGYSLRKFAMLVGISPTYLSHVEQGKVDTPPTVERVTKMAELLGESADVLLAAAGRAHEASAPIIRNKPEIPSLLRSVSNLSPEALRKLLATAKRLEEEGRKQ